MCSISLLQKNTLLFLVIISLSIGIVSATIDVIPTTQYDAIGSTPAYGEEIHSMVIIRPGMSEILNLTMQFNEVDAFIDKNSFEKTISPAGSPAKISFDGNLLFCDKLSPGEQLSITFNAYPKTIQRPLINSVNIITTYTQLGQKLTDQKTLTTDMSNSAWIELQNIQSKNDIATILIFSAVFIIVIIIILLIIWKIKTGNPLKEADRIRNRYLSFIERIDKKVQNVEKNPSEIIELKTIIEEEYQKVDKESTSQPTPTVENKPRKVKQKEDKF